MYSVILNLILLFFYISCMNEIYMVNYLLEKLVNFEFKGLYIKFMIFKVILKKICIYICFNVFSYKIVIYYESIIINMLIYIEK